MLNPCKEILLRLCLLLSKCSYKNKTSARRSASGRCTGSGILCVQNHCTDTQPPQRKGKNSGYPVVDTCYSTAYRTRDQKRFTISEVAADWQELMTLQRIMRPSTVRANEQLYPRCSTQMYHLPNQPAIL